MIKNITIGSDPEFFVVDLNNKVVPSQYFLPGDKKNPYNLQDGYAVLRDNVLVEGNIPPARDKGEFIHHMLKLQSLIKENFLAKEYKIVYEDSMKIEQEDAWLPEVMEFGCSPYMNAWTFEEEHPFLSDDISLYRTAGTHIHIGYSYKGIHKKQLVDTAITRLFDLFLVIPSLLESFSEVRWQFYGGLGKYRATSYGLECRGLGGRYGHPNKLPWIYDNTLKLLSIASIDDNIEIINSYFYPGLEKISNKSDLEEFNNHFSEYAALMLLEPSKTSIKTF